MGGVFVALLLGIVFATLMAIYEFWQHYVHQKRQQKVLISEDFHYFLDEICQHRSYGDIIENNEFEYYWYSFPRDQVGSARDHRSLILEMFEEARYAFQCINERKRLSLRRYCAKCQQSRNVRVINGLLNLTKNEIE
uniref:Uncharacterized protein n=1 Tax=Glossina brevipalpis TaxID=37001 RepID=A0A1A9WQ72_9MUSC